MPATQNHFSYLVAGQLVEGTMVIGYSEGPWYKTRWSGIYTGTAVLDGESYHMFRNGICGGVLQTVFGMPVAQFVSNPFEEKS